MMACQERSSSSQMQNSDSFFSVDAASNHDAERHLQSLGFIVDNGKPRFNLDYSTTAHSNASLIDFSIIDTNNPVSFVVLGKDSMDSIQASSLATYVDIQQKSMTADYNSMTSLLNSTEPSEQVNELLQENVKLKEALKQNNIAMKQQFNTLTTWQEEILKVQQNHKEKFAEMRELINYLKMENAELKLKLSSECTDNIETGYKIIDSINMKDEVKETKSISMAEFEEKILSLMNELRSSRLENTELSSNNKRLLSIQNLTSSQLEQATVIIQEQRQSIKELKLGSMQKQLLESSYTEHSRKTENTPCEKCITKDKEIDDLKESIALLEQKLRSSVSSVPFDEVSSSEVKDSTSLDTTLQEKANNSIDNEINNDDELKKCLEIQGTSNDKSLLEKQKYELMQEKEALEEEKKLIACQKNSLESGHKYLNDTMDLLQQERISFQEEKASLDQQSQLYEDFKKSLQMEKKQLNAKYDQLVAEISTLHESIQRKELHIQQLQIESIQHLENSNLLETQLKLYEEDFAQEKSIKDKLFEENNKINVDLQKQMELNQVLQQEIQRLNHAKTNQSQSEEASTAQEETPAELINPVMSTLACPKCGCNFHDIQSLVDHVQACLNLD